MDPGLDKIEAHKLAPWEKTPQDDGYGKHCSGFCGTGQMISRWDPNASDSCPNCGRFESAISSGKASATYTYPYLRLRLWTPSWQQDRMATLHGGNLPIAFKLIQQQHLLSHHKYLTIDVWMKGLID
eukprot:scaffold39082_cov150-Skeletonema_marinoi.AAC.2